MYLENKISGKRNCLSSNWKLRMKGWRPRTFKMESTYPTEEFLIKLLKIVTGDTEGQGGRRNWALCTFHATLSACFSQAEEGKCLEEKMGRKSYREFCQDFLLSVFSWKKVTWTLQDKINAPWSLIWIKFLSKKLALLHAMLFKKFLQNNLI